MYCLDAQPPEGSLDDEDSVRYSSLLPRDAVALSCPPLISSRVQGVMDLVKRSNAYTEYKASKSLYDASASVPGSAVGSDPSRAYILEDETLLTTVRFCFLTHCAVVVFYFLAGLSANARQLCLVVASLVDGWCR